MTKPARKQDKHGLPVPSLDDALDPETAAQLRKLPPRKQRDLHGLALWLNGYSLRQAAELTGSHYARLWRLCQRVGVTERDRNGLIDRIQETAETIADEAGRQVLAKLQEGAFSDSQLPVVYGIATDKAAKAADLRLKAEAHRKPQPESGLYQLLEQLQRSGGQFTLGYTPPEEQPQERTIDVESEDG